MKVKNKKETFDSYFESIYTTRWESLKKSMLKEEVYETIDLNGEKKYYMDPASVMIANELSLQPGEVALDMCAAPGGKSLILAKLLNGSGKLVCNDRSASRRERLRRVINETIPEKLKENIHITGHDANRWGLYEQNVYDKILLDAPCSSERHLLKQPKLLEKWSKARTKQLSIQQYAMLVSALTALKTKGTLIYSTCSISEEENDKVIDKLHKKKSGQFKILPINFTIGEDTKYGKIILPDTNNGMGPLYCVKLMKI